MFSQLGALQLAGVILPASVQLQPGVLPLRRLFLTVELADWVDQLSDEKEARSLVAPNLEFRLFQERFIAGRRIGTEIDRIMPTKHGVWSVKTPSLRIAGWFPEVDTIVLVSGATAKESKNRISGRHKNDLVQHVVAFRKAHSLGPGVAGDIRDVIQN